MTKLSRIFLVSVAVAIALSSWNRLSGDPSQALPDESKRAQYLVPEDDLYKSPIQMALTRNGSRLYVSCENSGEVLFVDTSQRKVMGGVKVGKQPFGLALSPDESRIYVSSRRDDIISVVDTARMEVAKSISVGAEPHGLAVDSTGRWLYVANLGTDDISVVDTAEFKEIKRLQAGRSPFGVAFRRTTSTCTYRVSSRFPFHFARLR